MASSANPDDLILLTVEEAAERMRMGRTLIYSLIKSGAIESIKVGRLRRIAPESLREYVSRRLSDSQSDRAA